MSGPPGREHCLSIAEITRESAPAAIHEARTLLLEYGRFVSAHPQAHHFCFGSLEKEAARLPDSYLEQGGGCLLGRDGNYPIGFVAWRTAPGHLADRAWELKRLWVRPELRGTGVGKALTEAVLARATVAGREAVYLDTLAAVMPAALRMYLGMGFVACPPYSGEALPGLTHLVKHLQFPESVSPRDCGHLTGNN